MKRLLMALLILMGTTGSVSAQSSTIDTAQIDAYITEVMAADRIPGLALAVVQGDEMVYAQGYGTTGVDNAPVTPNTAFQIGSMSKSFTALAIMQLVESGQVDLDAPVQRYLPEFTVGDSPESAAITVRHLLHHTSGIPVSAPRAEGDDQSLAAQVSALATAELRNPPGTVYEYASPNYIVLGRIVEVASGLSFAEYVEQRIFQPLEMSHSYSSAEIAQAGDFARGHHLWFGFPVASSLPHEPGRLPTASLYSSANDLGKYLIAHMNGDSAVLPEALMAELHAPAVPTDDEGQAYAMGWRVGNVNGVSAVHHGGILPDYRGKMVMLPELGWGVVVLTNVSSVMGRPSSHDIADNLAGMLAGQPLRDNSLSLSMIYLGISVGIGLVTLQSVRNLFTVRAWRAKQFDVTGAIKSPRKLLTSLGFGLIFPVLLLMFLPRAFGFSWQTFIEQMPDLAYWLIFIAGLEIFVTLVRVIAMTRRLQPAVEGVGI